MNALQETAKRLSDKFNCSVVVEETCINYREPNQLVSVFRIHAMRSDADGGSIVASSPSLEQSESEIHVQAEQSTPEYRAELMRKNAAELLKQAEELSPTKHEQPAN